MERIVVVGGGLSGLSLAYRLEQRLKASKVVVLEERNRLGGNIATIDHHPYRVEIGPNGFLDNNPSTINLCHDLGLRDQLLPASNDSARNRFLFLRGKMHLLPSSLWAFLKSDVVSWRAKYRILTERWHGRPSSNAEETIEDFMVRRVGKELAHTLADAFVTGIFAGDPSILSMNSNMPRIVAMERDYGSIIRGMTMIRKKKKEEARRKGEPEPPRQRMWSFSKGLGLLIETLKKSLRNPPVENCKVSRIEKKGQTFRIISDNRAEMEADRVILTCPAYQQAMILREFDQELSGMIAGIRYNRIAVVILAYKASDVTHRVDGFGYLTPQRDRRDVLGVQWCSSIFPGRAPSGEVLLRALCGGWNRPEVVDWDDSVLVGKVEEEMGITLGIKGKPLFRQVVRWPNAIPQYFLGHADLVNRIETRRSSHQGLYLGGNAYRGVAMNDCVEQAGILATAIADDIENGR